MLLNCGVGEDSGESLGLHWVLDRPPIPRACQKDRESCRWERERKLGGPGAGQLAIWRPEESVLERPSFQLVEGPGLQALCECPLPTEKYNK